MGLSSRMANRPSQVRDFQALQQGMPSNEPPWHGGVEAHVKHPKLLVLVLVLVLVHNKSKASVASSVDSDTV